MFSDEHGDYPRGAYLRNPPGSSHTPASQPGCVIFVKLWQFDPAQKESLRLDTGSRRFLPSACMPGVELLPLYGDGYEDVRLERWWPDCEVELGAPGGAELLVLEGGFSEGAEAFAPQSWLRLPAGSRLRARAGPAGARIWLKAGHLARAPKAPPGES